MELWVQSLSEDMSQSINTRNRLICIKVVLLIKNSLFSKPDVLVREQMLCSMIGHIYDHICFHSILDNTKSAENSAGGPSKNNDFMHIYGRDILGTQNC